MGRWINLNKPIEAVRVDGTGEPVPMVLLSRTSSLGGFTTNTCPNSSESNRDWKYNGENFCALRLWRIRNVKEDISSMSDEYLADQYRELLDEASKFASELTERGYTRLYNGRFAPVIKMERNEYSFRKTSTITIVI